MPKHFKGKSAFTLVEISIVLIIIGLLAGVTFTGVALLQSAESKTLLTEVQKLNQSIGQFQSVYKGMPGDITKATSYWAGTTNGNGGGFIDAETSEEPFAAVQQISQAGLLEGSYAGFTGIWDSGFTLATPSAIGNVIGAKGRVPAALYIKCCSGTDYSRTIVFNNHISLFSIYSTDITKRAGILTPIEANDLDKKIDDGVPDTGIVGGSGSYDGSAYVATGCYSGTGSTSTYDITVAANKNAQNCQMQFAYDWN